MNQIGRNIKKIRNVRGLSQQAFADLFQLTRGNISSYEEFRAEPKLDVLVRIAKYFGIPLSDFIEKDLSVNELLHYNAGLVLETEKLKLAQQLTKVPYIPILYIDDYITNYQNEDFIRELPFLILPGGSRSELLAIETDNRSTFPSGYTFNNGDTLIYELIVKENAHRITGRLGIMVNPDGISMGIYKEDAGRIMLALNEWITYPFHIDSDVRYWVLKASLTQVF